MVLGALVLSTLVLHQPASLRLPAVIGDNMVLQRDSVARIWGWTEPGRKITIKYGKITALGATKSDGQFEVELKKLKVGDAQDLIVSDGPTTRVFKNVAVGDVWICSGQSNMEWPLAAAKNGADAVPAANDPQIRLFQVEKNANPYYKGDVRANWVPCNPQAANGFSAVGYFFGLSMRVSEKVPIGLINTSWGGTRAEAWTSRDAMMSVDFLKDDVDRYEATQKGGSEAARENERIMKLRGGYAAVDSGNKGFDMGWAAADLDDSGWKSMNLPGMWESQGKEMQIDGSVWFRRTVEIPSELIGRDLTLQLGAIDDYDTAYFNGEKIGGMNESTPNVWQTPRVYKIPANLVKAGKNVIAVRVFDQMGPGGFSGPDDAMRLSASENLSSIIKLSGSWHYKVENGLPMPPTQIYPPEQAPAGLYEPMIRPLAPLGIRGAIWYQGESNAGRAWEYRKLLPTMIQCWRKAFNQGDFPFLIVQLANFMPKTPQPVESEWAELREAQAMTTKALRNVGMAVIIDIGEAGDIHPRNKEDVGYRLAMSARSISMKGSTMAGNSPMFGTMKMEGNSIRIALKDAKGLKTSDGGPVIGFAIAGADHKFVWAKAVIDGESVVVSSPDVAKPVAVRYGWANNPDVNLVNGMGLPASPFRTDTWPGLTEPKKK